MSGVQSPFSCRSYALHGHLVLLLQHLLPQTQQRISGFLRLYQRTLGAGGFLYCLPVQMLASTDACSTENLSIYIYTFELFPKLDSNGLPLL